METIPHKKQYNSSFRLIQKETSSKHWKKQNFTHDDTTCSLQYHVCHYIMLSISIARGKMIWLRVFDCSIKLMNNFVFSGKVQTDRRKVWHITQDEIKNNSFLIVAFIKKA